MFGSDKGSIGHQPLEGRFWDKMCNDQSIYCKLFQLDSYRMLEKSYSRILEDSKTDIYCRQSNEQIMGIGIRLNSNRCS